MAGHSQQILLCGAGATTYTRWNSADKSASINLTNNDLTATHAGTSGTQHGVRTVASKTSGLLYCEYTLTEVTDDDDIRLGIANSTASLTAGLGSDTNSWSFEQVNTGGATNFRKRTNNSTTNLTSTGQLGVDGVVVMMAWNVTAQKLWWGVSGVWMNPDGNPGAGNPVDGTNPTFSSVTGTLFPMITMFRNGNIVTANFGSSSFVHTIPAGYSGWTA